MGFNMGVPLQANGTIAPSRFVKLDTTGDNLAIQATAGSEIIGISKVDQKRTPGLAGSDTVVAADVGDACHIYTLGDYCMLQYGGTVTAGDLLKSDANGRGVTASGTDICGARAVESGVNLGFYNVQIVERKF